MWTLTGKNRAEKQNAVVIYKEGKDIRPDVRLEKEMVWLRLDQMSGLFGRDKSVVSRHIKNVFDEAELDKKAVVANFTTTAADDKIYKVDYTVVEVSSILAIIYSWSLMDIGGSISCFSPEI